MCSLVWLLSCIESDWILITGHLTIQVAKLCSNCGVNMGEYYCEICIFYDDDVSLFSLFQMSHLESEMKWRGLVVSYLSIGVSTVSDR